MPNRNSVFPQILARTAGVNMVGLFHDGAPFLEWKYCYGRIRRWLQENKCRCELVNDKITVHLQNGQHPQVSGNGSVILQTIDSLPPESIATPDQAQQLFEMVRAGMLEWSNWQYDGQFCMRDYALEGLKHFATSPSNDQTDALP